MVKPRIEGGDYEPRWLFDPAGLLLVGIVGVSGVFLLVKHGWLFGTVCVALAALGLIASHRHFDPPAEAEDL